MGAGKTLIRTLYKEVLIYSSMSRVAGQIGKIATRTAQVVTGIPARYLAQGKDTGRRALAHALDEAPQGQRSGDGVKTVSTSEALCVLWAISGNRDIK